LAEERRSLGRLSPQLVTLESETVQLKKAKDASAKYVEEVRTEKAAIEKDLADAVAERDKLESLRVSNVEEIKELQALQLSQEKNMEKLRDQLTADIKRQKESETRSRNDSMVEIGRIEYELNAKVDGLGKELAKSENELRKRTEEKERIELKCKVSQEELEELRKEAELSKDAIKLFKVSVAKITSEKQRLEEDKIAWDDEKDRREKEKMELSEMISALKSEARDRKKEESKLLKEREQLKEKAADLEAALVEDAKRIEDIELAAEEGLAERGELKRKLGEMEALRRKLAESEKRRDGFEESLEIVKASEAELKKEVHELTLESEVDKGKLSVLGGELGESTRESKRLKAALERERASLEQMKVAEVDLSSERESLETALDEAREETRKLQAELDSKTKEEKKMVVEIARGEEASVKKDEMQRALFDVRDELKATKAALQSKEKELAIATDEVGRLEREMAAAESERETSEDELRGDVRHWREELENERKLLRTKEAELRAAAISAQNSELQVDELNAALGATSVDFGLRMKELEDESRDLRGRLGEKERELIGVRVRVTGEEQKRKDLEDEIKRGEEEIDRQEQEREKLLADAAELKKEIKAGEKKVKEVEEALQKEKIIRGATEKREKNVKGDCEVLSGELVEMGRKLDTVEAELAKVRKDLKTERGLKEDKEIELRKLKEWCRIRDESSESEVRELKVKLGDLEAEKRMVEGEKKGLKMELRRSRIGSGVGAGGGMRSSRRHAHDVGADGGAGSLDNSFDTSFSPMKANHLEQSSLMSGIDDDDDDDDDLVNMSSRSGYSMTASQRKRGDREQEVARNLRDELNRSHNL
jgi:chromosome segregation ATPase